MTEEEHNLLFSIANDVSGLKQDVSVLKEDVSGLKEDVSGLKEDVFTLKKSVNDMGKEIVRQRQNMAELEFRLSEKIQALFDDREVIKDYFKRNDERFNSIENILENHSIRIANLESNY